MKSRRVVVVGASEAGCRVALAAQAAGHQVTLVDEHPQAMKDMALDAPWFYGAALPAALMNENAVAQSVLEARPLLADCFEAGVDVRVSTVLWGAFRNGPNSLHVGTPRVGLVTRDHNELLEHDALVIATGVRDFVPSFAGWDLPGVFGAKAGLALLDLYQVFEGKRLLVLGSSDLAMRLVRSALARGVSIAGMAEPGDAIAAGPAAADWLAAQGIPVHLGHVIAEATGKTAATGARLVPVGGGNSVTIDCDSIAFAIAALPNIELPAAMGCQMRYEPALASSIPVTTTQGETSLEDVFWLAEIAGDTSAIEAGILARLGGVERDLRLAAPPHSPNTAQYVQRWIEALQTSGDDNVILCQCEGVTRGELCGIAPPRYLQRPLRHPQTALSASHDATAPRINQDFAKRMTRVAMGHCQGKRCRDEAAFTLALRFGVPVETIRPASYRFPLRPLELGVIADNDETDEIRLNWQMWPYENRKV